MRPGWCPFPMCQWITGGGCSDDSGSFCFGELPSQTTHFGTVNTHRLCCRTADNHVDNWEINRTDVWYTKRFLSNVLRILDATDKAGEGG